MDEKEISKTWKAFLKDLRESTKAEIEKDKLAQKNECESCKIQ